MEAKESERFEGWCIVELMGHNVIAGYVTEQVIGGAAMLRVDVPLVAEDRQPFTKFFAPSAIYGITPTTETAAWTAASRLRTRPIDLWIIPDRPAQSQLPQRDEEDAEREGIEVPF